MKILAKKEGRDGIWSVEKNNIIAWLKENELEVIHNFTPSGGGLIIGADWDKESVVEKINNSEGVAVLTGKAKQQNMNHALAVIVDNKLYVFDIGDINDSDIEDVTPQSNETE